MTIQLILHLLDLHIETRTLDVQYWIGRLYSPNDLRAIFPERGSRMTLLIERSDTSAARRIRHSVNGVFAETNLCGAKCFYEDGRFFSSSDGAFSHELEYDIGASTITANVGGEYCRSGQSIVSNMLRPILQSFILSFSGLKTIHGAVVSKSDRTVFLSGHGGMGKTTAALQLVRGGYSLLSDDGPFFFTQDNKAHVLSSLDYVHLTANTLHLFPELQSKVVGDKDSREKYSIRISDIQENDDWRKPHEITNFVQLRRRPGIAAPRLIKMSRNVVHQQLLNESMVIFRREEFREGGQFKLYTEFVFDLLMKVAQSADTHELEYSDQHLPDLPMLIDQL